MEHREKWENWVLVALGVIAGLLAVVAVELGGVDYALYWGGFEVNVEQTTNE